MDCLVVAGGIPGPNDPLFVYSQGQPKALISIGGRTMLEWVVDALQGAKSVDAVLVVGADSVSGLSFREPVHFLPDQGNLVANGLAGIAWLNQHRPGSSRILLSSADIPAVTSQIIDRFVEMCRPFDSYVYYSLVLEETLEARFPDSGRTFVPLKGARVAGGDIFIASPEIANANPALMEALASGRKAAWRLARIVGFRALLRFLLRQLSIEDVVELATRMAGFPVDIIVSPFAEIAMDVDRPEHLRLLAAEVGRKKT